MEILHLDDKKNGKFFVSQGSKVLAEMTYVWAGEDKIIIDHTDVKPELNGKGAGKQLLFKAVEFARKNNIKIIPLCPFAKSMFDKLEEIRDVLAK